MYRAIHVHLATEQYYRAEFKIKDQWYPIENALRETAKFAKRDDAISAAKNAYNKAFTKELNLLKKD